MGKFFQLSTREMKTEEEDIHLVILKRRRKGGDRVVGPSCVQRLPAFAHSCLRGTSHAWLALALRETRGFFQKAALSVVAILLHSRLGVQAEGPTIAVRFCLNLSALALQSNGGLGCGLVPHYQRARGF